jgi:hypothetical protein
MSLRWVDYSDSVGERWTLWKGPKLTTYSATVYESHEGVVNVAMACGDECVAHSIEEGKEIALLKALENELERDT